MNEHTAALIATLPDTMEQMVDARIDSIAEYGFGDYATENLNDQLRDLGIAKDDRWAIINAVMDAMPLVGE